MFTKNSTVIEMNKFRFASLHGHGFQLKCQLPEYEFNVQRPILMGHIMINMFESICLDYVSFTYRSASFFNIQLLECAANGIVVDFDDEKKEKKVPKILNQCEWCRSSDTIILCFTLLLLVHNTRCLMNPVYAMADLFQILGPYGTNEA
ncbi:hypothetical protein BLOT_008403 [Blomia tropicalis]|nr:hypothetical protein BLOT_008403 [Blomia tropicalis]